MALLVCEETAGEYGLKPRAKILSGSNYGVNRNKVLDGVIPGTSLALKMYQEYN